MPYETDYINFQQYNDLLRNEKNDYGEQIFFSFNIRIRRYPL